MEIVVGVLAVALFLAVVCNGSGRYDGDSSYIDFRYAGSERPS